jgi:antitoxin (DNA-binding transcriptional repressor) of toxin-antitoxin stability system
MEKATAADANRKFSRVLRELRRGKLRRDQHGRAVARTAPSKTIGLQLKVPEPPAGRNVSPGAGFMLV